MDSKEPDDIDDEKVYLALQALQRKSSPESVKHVKHLLSSQIPTQRMKSNQCNEWYHELCNQVEPEDALKLMVFAVKSARCNRDELKKLRKLVGLQREPCLNDFSHLEGFSSLKLHKLVGDIAYQGISAEAVRHIARHRLNCNPDKYVPAGASDVSFEGCLLLLNDAVQQEVFTLDDLTPLVDMFDKHKETKTKVLTVLKQFGDAIKHSSMTTPHPEYPPTVSTPPAYSTGAAQPQQPPLTTAPAMHGQSLAHPPSASAPNHPGLYPQLSEVYSQPHPTASPDNFEQPAPMYHPTHRAQSMLPVCTQGERPFDQQPSSAPPSYSDVINQSQKAGMLHQENPNRGPVARSFSHVTTRQQQQYLQQYQQQQQQHQQQHVEQSMQQAQHMGVSALEPTHSPSQHQRVPQALTPSAPSVYSAQCGETSEPNPSSTHSASLGPQSQNEPVSFTQRPQNTSLRYHQSSAPARSEQIFLHSPPSGPPVTTQAPMSSLECLGALEPMQSRAPITSSQGPHSSQSTHPVYQQGKEDSLEAVQRGRAASDSSTHRSQKAGTGPSPLISGELSSSAFSSDFSVRDRSTSFPQATDQLRRPGGSSLRSGQLHSQESEDGVHGSSEFVASSEMLYPGSQNTPAQLYRQDHIERRPQLERQSSIIDQVYALLHKSYDALPYFEAAKATKQNGNTVLPPLRRISDEQECVGYTDFFQLFPHHLEEVHTVVIAESGYGKTTLMITAAKEWRKGTILTNIEVLLLVPMSKLCRKTSIELRDMLELYLDSKEKCECAAKALTEDAGKGLCILFDGLEEGPYPEVLDFIRGVKLQNASVFATCHPHSTIHKELEGPKVSFYTIEGLQSSHIQQYAGKYFPREEEATKFLKYLEEHPNIKMMCSVPMHLSIIACLFDTNKKAALDSFTETDILEAFIVYIAQCSIKQPRELSSLTQLASHYHAVFPNLCKESLQLAKENILILPDHLSTEHALTVFNTVLVREKRGSAVNTHHVCRFSHAVVRDFFAAFGLKSSQQIGEEHTLPDGVLKFLCGLQSGQLKEDSLSRIIYHNTDQGGYVSMLPFHCVYQTKVARFCSYLIEKLNHSVKLKAPETPLTVSDCFVLAYVILKGLVHELEFGPRSLTLDCLKVFTESLEKSTLASLKKLTICGPLDAGAGDYITRILQKCQALQHLSLNGIPLAQEMFIGLHINLKSMSLSKCSLNHEAASLLGQTLKQLQELEVLDLSYNPLGTEGLKALKDGLSSCHSLTQLRMRGCLLSPDSGKVLSETLLKLKELRSLDLEDNKLRAEGIGELQSVALYLSSLRSVSFANNSLSNEDQLFPLVGFAICCEKLEELRLNSNGLGPECEVVKLLHDRKPHLRMPI